MRTFFLASVALAALSGAAMAQARQDFAIVNKTGYDIKEVYVSTSKTNNWEEDVLGKDSLDDGETTTIHFNGGSRQCMWDLKVVYEDDDSSAVWSNIDLCKVSRVTLHYNRKSDVTSADFD